MKKIILSVLLCAVLISAVSCGQPPSENTDSTASNAPVSGTESDTEADIPKKEDIFGSIKEIAGNLATIELAVMTEAGIPTPGAGGMMRFDPENMPEGFEISTNEDGGGFSIGDGGERSFSIPEGFEMPTNEDGSLNLPEGARSVFGGEGGNGPVISGEGPVRNEDGSITLPDGSTISGDEIQSIRQSVGVNSAFLDYTGEEIEFILPVGIPIYAVTKDEEGNQVETEINLNDIANKNVISVTYKEDGKTIDKILVSQVTAAAFPELPEGMTRPEEAAENPENTEDNEGGNDE